MREIMSRFHKYMEYKNLNDNQVTIQCGLSQGLLGQARRGKSDLGKKTIDVILKTYQDLNRIWLLTGEGEMLKDEEENPAVIEGDLELVPLIPIGAFAGEVHGFSAEGVVRQRCEMVVSPIPGCDIAIDVSGDSMEPEFPNGCRVFCKRIYEESFIAWGNVFVLDTCNGAFIKRVFPSDEDDNAVEARSINTAYPPFKIPKSSIYGMYRVLLMARGYSAS